MQDFHPPDTPETIGAGTHGHTPRLTVWEAIKELNSIDMSHDPESAHDAADRVLRLAVDARVDAAYRECVKRTGRWWFA